MCGLWSSTRTVRLKPRYVFSGDKGFTMDLSRSPVHVTEDVRRVESKRKTQERRQFESVLERFGPFTSDFQIQRTLCLVSTSSRSLPKFLVADFLTVGVESREPLEDGDNID